MAAAASSSTARILLAQNNVFKHHLSPALMQRMEIPSRHRGMNSVKFPASSTNTASLPPLVVMHGFGSGLAFFFATLPHLVSSGRTVYLADWLGFGGSERPRVGRCSRNGPVTAEFFTAPLRDWMEAERIDKCTLVGHSLGGLLACRFAERFPEKLSALVLASPAGMSRRITPPPPPSTAYRNKLLDLLWDYNAVSPQRIVRSLGQTRGRALVHRAVHGRFGAGVPWNATLVADYLYEISAARGSAGEAALGTLLQAPFTNRDMVAREPIPPALPSTVRVHTIFGDHDWLNTSGALEHAKRLGGLSIMHQAGHHLYLDQPEEFARQCIV